MQGHLLAIGRYSSNNARQMVSAWRDMVRPRLMMASSDAVFGWPMPKSMDRIYYFTPTAHRTYSSMFGKGI